VHPNPQVELTPDGLTSLLGRKVLELERIGGGRNSQVYRVTDAASQSVALKVYLRHPSDSRDRQGTEFNSFSLLWENGICDIPQPLANFPERNMAVYGYVAGTPPTVGEVGQGEVDQCVEFLSRLRSLTAAAQNWTVSPASEAFFSIARVLQNVQERLERISQCQGEAPAEVELQSFLQSEFRPTYERITAWIQQRVSQAGLSMDQELPLAERTLSPSDFGFHNAIQRPDGRLIFLDFEYFGWDDPAKMVADFLLHPAIPLSANLRRHFTRGVLRCFADCPKLSARLKSVYPLFGLKWCLILLNEFLPEALVRRQFAAGGAVDRSALQWQQLAKARQMLQRVEAEYQNFPYDC
jgi:hypothetical protein